MYKKGIQKFDEITVYMNVKEFGLDKEFKKYNGMMKIKDYINIVKNKIKKIK